MTELRDEHLEVITKNKIRAHEEQKDMRDELAFFVMNCTISPHTNLHLFHFLYTINSDYTLLRF